jgi:hypothetical protein
MMVRVGMRTGLCFDVDDLGLVGSRRDARRPERARLFEPGDRRRRRRRPPLRLGAFGVIGAERMVLDRRGSRPLGPE